MILIPERSVIFWIKKNILINQKQVHWNEMVKTRDVLPIDLTGKTSLKKSFGANPDLVQEVYQDQHLIIVNKPGNEITEINLGEIALLNHVSAYVGQTCYVVHRLDMENKV